MEKCLELDVPSGTPLLELKRGNDITLDNGQIVKHSDVYSTLKPARNIISELTTLLKSYYPPVEEEEVIFLVLYMCLSLNITQKFLRF